MDLPITHVFEATMLAEQFVVESPLFIPAAQVQTIMQEAHLASTRELLELLVPIAQTFARPQISAYFVGVAALGESGNIYLGCNLEFAGVPLNQAVHGEQFLIVNAFNHGETKLVDMALSAAPCGHCRQFMQELGDESTHGLHFLLPRNESVSFTELLPQAFGPADLGLTGGLLSAHTKASDSDDLRARAKEAAQASYAPYTQSPSGIAIRTKDGQIFTGSYLENAGYNPSLSPLQAALVALVMAKKEYTEIEKPY